MVSIAMGFLGQDPVRSGAGTWPLLSQSGHTGEGGVIEGWGAGMVKVVKEGFGGIGNSHGANSEGDNGCSW